MDCEIVFGGPAESKGATRAAAAGFSVELSQENEVRNRLRETDVERGSIEADRKMRSMPTRTTIES